MKNNDKMNHLFQTGVILGRITQLCIDRGIVMSGSVMGLSDFFNLLIDEVKNLPVSDSLITQILGEINTLSGNLSGYQKEARLEPDDARIMIGFVSRWTDMLFDEFTNLTGEKSVIKGEAGFDSVTKSGNQLPESPPDPLDKKGSDIPTPSGKPDLNPPVPPDISTKNVKEKDPSNK